MPEGKKKSPEETRQPVNKKPLNSEGRHIIISNFLQGCEYKWPYTRLSRATCLWGGSLMPDYENRAERLED